MVTFIPAKDDWANAFRELGSGVVQGYQNRSDELAIQNALKGLGPNAHARDILNAITNTKTHSPAAKQQALSNYLGVEQFEELKRKTQAQEGIASAKNSIAQAKETREQNKIATERTNTKSIVNQLDLAPEQKEALGETISQDAAESLLKEQLKPKEGTFDKVFNQKLAEDYINISKVIP